MNAREAAIEMLSRYASEPMSFTEESSRRWAEILLDELIAAGWSPSTEWKQVGTHCDNCGYIDAWPIEAEDYGACTGHPASVPVYRRALESVSAPSPETPT